MSEITHAFDDLLTQLTLIRLRAKVSICKLWNPSRISLGIEILQGCTLVINGLRILGVPIGFQNFAMHFLYETLFQNVIHINDPPFLRDT
jgi:hypothetical protein